MYFYLYTRVFLFIYSYILIYIPNYIYVFVYMFQIVISFDCAHTRQIFFGHTVVCQRLGVSLFSSLYLPVHRMIDLSPHCCIGNNNLVINPAISAY
jgi:hypothetical protein